MLANILKRNYQTFRTFNLRSIVRVGNYDYSVETKGNELLVTRIDAFKRPEIMNNVEKIEFYNADIEINLPAYNEFHEYSKVEFQRKKKARDPLVPLNDI